MRKILSLVLFMCSMYSMHAQNISITGNVKGAEDQLGLPGVNVIVKNSNTAAVTDFDGNFKIDAPVGSVLEFSYLGFQTQEVPVINNNPLNVSLKIDAQSLSEVVVVGYGTQKKRDLTGAVSIVSAKTIEDLRPIKIEQALQGTVSGVNVTSQSGSPGGGLDIRIRGIGTNGENKPLVIIDGYQGDIDLLNPSDIETITVLKDAQAAVYGTLGANGVILITTKRGKFNSKTKVSFNSYYGFQQTSKKLNVLDATEYALLKNEAYINAGQSIPFTNITELGVGTDWQDEVFETTPIFNHDINISGGGENIAYSISGSTLDQKGIVAPDKSNYTRNTARLALTAKLWPKTKVESNLIYTHVDRETIQEGGLGSVLFNAINTPPTLSPYTDEGDFTPIPNEGIGAEVINPLHQIANTYNSDNTKKINGNISLTHEFFEGFKGTSRIGFNTSNSKFREFKKEIDYEGEKNNDVIRNFVTQNATNDNDYTFDLFLTYQKTFAEKHNITFTAGHTAFKTWGNQISATGFDVPNNAWEFADLDLAKGVSDSGAPLSDAYNYDVRRSSYFGRLEYNFNSKYLFSAMLRRDVSSKFSKENRVAYFPSFTAGWVVSDESFLTNNDILDFLKFRLSYGILGNDQIPDNIYVGLLSGEGNYVFNGDTLYNGSAFGTIINEGVTWEEDEKLDIGFDLKLLSNKLEVTADYFRNERKNLLIEALPVSGILGGYGAGSENPTINAGTVLNKGFEIALSYRDNIGEEFRYNLGINASFIENEVLKVNNNTGFIEGGNFIGDSAPPSRMEVGQPIGYFYGYKVEGIYQNINEINNSPSVDIENISEVLPGDLKYVDVNNDGVIDTNDKTNIGDPIPDYTLGINLGFDYKNFDFNVYGFASIGNDMVRSYEKFDDDINYLDYKIDRWTGEGSTNETPRLTIQDITNHRLLSEFYVEDASYFRIQNIQVGYTLPKIITETMGVEKLRLYTAITNLHTFTKYRGFDPSFSSADPGDGKSGDPLGAGIDYGVYPNPRTYMLGVNVNF